MPGAARVGDMHTCPLVNPDGSPHTGGPLVGPGEPTVLIEGLPAAVIGDTCICIGPPDTVALGSQTVFIGGKPAVRMGDTTAHGGQVVAGSATVIIG